MFGLVLFDLEPWPPVGCGAPPTEAIKLPGQQFQDLLWSHRVQIVGKAELLCHNRNPPCRSSPPAAKTSPEFALFLVPDQRSDRSDQRLAGDHVLVGAQLFHGVTVLV